jgi:N-[(2S)-2-amino-2-carboxyethyl]-L-glutamate dehydrogenase
MIDKNTSDIRIINAQEVRRILTGRELDLIQLVRAAYETHAGGESSLPHSTFLRFPSNQRDRIIALPAYLGQPFDIAGVKWIASFPNNSNLGLERASAIIVVNSPETGQPKAILEGSIISAQRTAASAALAAAYLHVDSSVSSIGVIGCGLINREIVHFLLAIFPNITRLVVFDIDQGQSQRFAQKYKELREDLEVDIAQSIDTVFRNSKLISFATVAGEPHVHDISACAPGSTLLHISLRDLSPEVILSSNCDNIADDIDHVCRSQTSLHLAEQQIHHRNFIRCTLSDITRGLISARSDPDQIAIFSPFGLGVLDLALSKFVTDFAQENDIGVIIKSFLQ